MEKKDFLKGTKPREIFVYICERIAEPLIPLGYKYRKSKNDIYKKNGIFVFSFWFQPSIRFGSTTFLAHFDVSSPSFAQWCNRKEGCNDSLGGIVGTSLARLTRRYDDWLTYDVSTYVERERSIRRFLSRFRNTLCRFSPGFLIWKPCWMMWSEKGSFHTEKALTQKSTIKKSSSSCVNIFKISDIMGC